MKRRTVVKIVIAISVICLAGYRLSPLLFTSGPQLVAYDESRDKAELKQLFEQERYWVTDVPGYDSDIAFHHQTYRLDRSLPGSLKIAVIRDNGHACGFTAYFKRTFNVGQMLFLAVSASCRGKGYGTNLMKYACEQLKKMGCNEIKVTVRPTNTVARSLYERYGFTIDRETDRYVFMKKRV